MVKVAYIDFETRSACDLKASGAYVYSQHPTTDVICLAYALDDGPIKLWKPGEELPGDLWRAYIDDKCWVVAHNSLFERSVWENIMVPQWSWPAIPEDQWFDSMAACARKAIPLDLELACKAVHLSVQKDMEGNAALKKIMKPNPKTGEFNEDPELYEKVYAYCPIDVEATRALISKVGTLTKSEMEIWRLNQRMNWRGVNLDLTFVADCQAVADAALPPLAAAFRELTGLRASQRDKVLHWVRDRFTGFPNMQKEVVAEALTDWPIPDDVRTALELRSAITSTSLTKLKSMRACAGSDSRARGLIQYHGATTGRDAGRLLQPQNFPRGTVEFGKDDDGKEVLPWDTLVPAIQTRDAALIGVMFASSEANISDSYKHLTAPISAVSSALRHCITAERGRLLCAGDFSTIEARITLAIAGQYDRLHHIASGGDPYCELASIVLGREITKENGKKERQEIGKPTVLGCGFQMGARKFHQRYMKKQPFELAQTCVDTYREEWAPEVPKLWYALEEAANKTVWDRRPHSTHGITYAIEDEWLTCRLHSGRKLYYLHPRACQKEMPWSTPEHRDVRPGWTYTTKKMGMIQTVTAYGGLLTENVVQATARDILYNRAFVAEKENFPLILTVHDELVTEPEEQHADPKTLKQIMEDAPAWVKTLGVPISTECWVGERYRK